MANSNLVTRQKPHHDVPVTCPATPTVRRSGVRPCSSDGRVTHSTVYLVTCTVGRCARHYRAVRSDNRHGNRVVIKTINPLHRCQHSAVAAAAVVVTVSVTVIVAVAVLATSAMGIISVCARLDVRGNGLVRPTRRRWVRNKPFGDPKVRLTIRFNPSAQEWTPSQGVCEVR
jgi:hypothetical protein